MKSQAFLAILNMILGLGQGFVVQLLKGQLPSWWKRIPAWFKPLLSTLLGIAQGLLLAGVTHVDPAMMAAAGGIGGLAAKYGYDWTRREANT